RRRGGGGEDRPADSTGGRPTARRNAGTRAGGTGGAALGAGVGQQPRPTVPQSRGARGEQGRRGGRGRPQPGTLEFFAAIVRGVKSASHPQNGARASGFVAPPAVRRCGG